MNHTTMASSEANPKPTPKHLDLPTSTPGSAHTRPGILSPHLLPATALFHGPHSRNDSHGSLHRFREDRDRDTARTPVDKPQHLPRANPPTSSFSGPRPTLIGEQKFSHTSQHPTFRHSATKVQDNFQADAVWAEMQKTLADVELSAMNSSHVFSSEHARALEDLRGAQLGLAMAWAKSEGDEMIDAEFGKDEAVVGHSLKGGMFGAGNAAQSSNSPSAGKTHSRQGSASSASGKAGNLEEETERDIRLARKRREANDKYFKQVNKGVLDVVKKLDEVVGAMRRVEKESREIWNESSGSEDLGDVTETDDSVKVKEQEKEKRGGRARAATADSTIITTTGDDTDGLTDSPTETKNKNKR